MLHMCACVRACVCVCLRACVRAYVCVNMCVCVCVCVLVSVSFNAIGTTSLQFCYTQNTNNYNMAAIEVSASLYCSRPRICNARSAFMFIYFNILVFTDCLYFDRWNICRLLFFQILSLLFLHIYIYIYIYIYK